LSALWTNWTLFTNDRTDGNNITIVELKNKIVLEDACINNATTIAPILYFWNMD
jgi:hypothetical protein